METLLREQTVGATTDRVMELLDPNPDYSTTYQPLYPDQGALGGAVYELHSMHPITTPARVDALQARLTALAEGADTPLIGSGRCAEPVRLDVSIERHVANIATERAIAMRAIRAAGGRALFVPRALGQAVKPRSSGPIRRPDGALFYPYMGDAVNGEAEHERIPKPSRMVGMATQSRDVKRSVEEITGEQLLAAHEALLLPYEHAMTRVDPRTGKLYGLSGELLWAGMRTNDTSSGPIEFLAQIENPRGVKIGPDTKPDDIDTLVQILNPEHVPGKLIFMLRTGPQNAELQQALLRRIQNVAPESLLDYDLHGITRPGEGDTKIRCVPELIADIKNTARACGRAGLKLHGVHLESIVDDSRLECVDRPDQLPTHPGGVDPQLNPRQLAHVLGAVASCLL